MQTTQNQGDSTTNKFGPLVRSHCVSRGRSRNASSGIRRKSAFLSSAHSQLLVRLRYSNQTKNAPQSTPARRGANQIPLSTQHRIRRIPGLPFVEFESLDSAPTLPLALLAHEHAPRVFAGGVCPGSVSCRRRLRGESEPSHIPSCGSPARELSWWVSSNGTRLTRRHSSSRPSERNQQLVQRRTRSVVPPTLLCGAPARVATSPRSDGPSRLGWTQAPKIRR